MMDTNDFFKRQLPHYQPSSATYFVTFRLADTLPAEVIQRLRENREAELRHVGQDAILSYNVHKKYFARFDQFLDHAACGPHWLANETIAKIVADTLHSWDGKKYELICYCIMSNHVHVVFSTDQEIHVAQVKNLRYTLSPIMHSIKRLSARKANKVLYRSGQFWQHESYDHVVRKGEELLRVVSYVINNPVKAGTTDDWKKWKWSYVQKKLLDCFN